MQKISVIVPVYDGGKYIEKCVNRLLEEKEHLHEIIIVNDGSMDNTKEILKKFERAPQIIVITQENKGVSAARNKGIETSTGDWIVFCDVDDEIREGYFCDIERSLEERCGVDLICFARGKVGDGDTGVGEQFFDKKKAVLLSLGHDIDNLLNDYIFMSVWSKVFKKDIIENNNIRFDENISYAEDVLFLMKYLMKAERIDLIHRGYYVYLPNEEGACKHGGSIKDYEGFFSFDKELWETINKNSSLLKDEIVIASLEEYLISFGKIMCGRVARGTRGDKISLRSRYIKDICRKLDDYRAEASLKQRVVLDLKKYFPRLYIMANDKKQISRGRK